MRWPICAFAAGLLLLMMLLIQSPAAADTLFDKRKGLESIQAYQKYLRAVRAKLYVKDEDDREDAFELIEDSLKKPPLDGDEQFPLGLLGDLMLGTEFPKNGELDEDIQEEGLEHLIDSAIDDDFSISRREFALGQLRRVVRAKRLVRTAFRDDTFEALLRLSEDPRLVLAHGAINALGAIAAREGVRWAEKGEAAAEILIDQMDGKDIEIRRIAILETIETLHGAKRPNDLSRKLWEELSDAVEDIESPSLQVSLRPHLTRLIKTKGKSSFADQVKELKEAMDDAPGDFKARAKPAEGPYAEILAQLTEEDDLSDLEALLARVEAEGRADPTLRAMGLATVMAKASNPEIPSYTLRVLLDSLLRQGRVAGSPMMYYRAATQLLDLTFTHSANGKANIPLSQLARLLASTDRPGLVLPVLEEIKAMAMAKTQPVWIGRRMVALLFLQAGDSPNKKIRQHALQLLEETGKMGRNWAIRREVWTRMALLARFARDAGVKSRATSWLKG